MDLEGLAEVGDDRRVQRLIQVGLGRCDIVLDAPRHGLPLLVDLAEHFVALVHRADDDAHRRQVVDLIERLVLRRHLLIDGIEVLGTPEHLAVDVAFDEDLLDLFDDVIDKAVALFEFLMDVLDEVFERLGIEIFEAERGIDIQRLARHALLPLLGEEVQRAHVVQAVGKLDDDDADVLRHGDEELSKVFRLLLFLRLEDDLIELGDARDEG